VILRSSAWESLVNRHRSTTGSFEELLVEGTTTVEEKRVQGKEGELAKRRDSLGTERLEKGCAGQRKKEERQGLH